MSIIIKDNTIAVVEESVGNFNSIKNHVRENINGLSEHEIELIANYLSTSDSNNVIWNYKKLLDFYAEFPDAVLKAV